MTELKKCPFCGGEAELLECTSGWYVDCKDDCIRLAYDTKEEAIEAWNRSGKMTERLAKKENDGRVLVLFNGYYTRTEDRNLLKYAEKLAHYEDLEEQGRLVVLPEGFNLKVFKETVAERYCPRFFGLNDVGCEGGKSIKISDCLECWEHEMKGEQQ